MRAMARIGKSELESDREKPWLDPLESWSDESNIGLTEPMAMLMSVLIGAMAGGEQSYRLIVCLSERLAGAIAEHCLERVMKE